ncbi:MAG: hypothetical protein F6K11_19825 [Leptolyngbya sp. SIO3F4]|nr:hypothetical protein [Leptolyngbya sp. SIO3F4]
MQLKFANKAEVSLLRTLDKKLDSDDLSRDPSKNPSMGYASLTVHHGELLQGMFYDQEDKLYRALVTLPCQLFKTETLFIPERSKPVKVNNPFCKTKAQKAARITLRYLGLISWGGQLEIHSDVPQGLGLGSSTSDVTSSILAVANAFGRVLSLEEISLLSVQAERASDPIIFGNRAVLFAHRDGVVVEDLGGDLPPLEVIGFNSEKQNKTVDTLSLPPACYNWREIEEFRVLLGLMRKAIKDQDPRLIGKVASASARINQKYLKKAELSKYESLVQDVGALGLQIAHSGTVVGIILDPCESNLKQKVKRIKSILYAMNYKQVWHFSN